MDVGAPLILLACRGFHIASSPEDRFFNRSPNTAQGIPELVDHPGSPVCSYSAYVVMPLGVNPEALVGDPVSLSLRDMFRSEAMRASLDPDCRWVHHRSVRQTRWRRRLLLGVATRRRLQPAPGMRGEHRDRTRWPRAVGASEPAVDADRLRRSRRNVSSPAPTT